VPTLLRIDQEWEEELTNGSSPGATREYAIVTDDMEYSQIQAEADLRAELDTLGHMVYGNLPVSQIVVKRLRASKCFRGIVNYGMRELPDHGTWDAKVDSRPESRKTFRGTDAPTVYAAPGQTAPEHSGLVGVDQNNDVQGIEIYFPVKTYAVQVYWRTDQFTGAQASVNHQSLQNYIDLLDTLESKLNSLYFEFNLIGAVEKFQPLECLLASSSRSWASPGLIRIDLEFKKIKRYQDALVNAWAGTPTWISGWDAVHFPTRKQTHTPSSTIVPTPFASLVTPTYGRADLNLLKVPLL